MRAARVKHLYRVPVSRSRSKPLRTTSRYTYKITTRANRTVYKTRSNLSPSLSLFSRDLIRKDSVRFLMTTGRWTIVTHFRSQSENNRRVVNSVLSPLTLISVTIPLFSQSMISVLRDFYIKRKKKHTNVFSRNLRGK